MPSSWDLSSSSSAVAAFLPYWGAPTAAVKYVQRSVLMTDVPFASTFELFEKSLANKIPCGSFCEEVR